ncbi:MULTISPECIES: hypothetical protein [Streptomyces]|uniref:hypothetical protein n=1 Tax=Streptomyces TaxID=1883 RepID=UPI000A8B9303|nr:MULTISPECIES: hypothetical protein [Streptomyces]
MADSTDRPETAPPPPPFPPAPPAAHWPYPPAPPRRRGRGLLIAAAVVAALLAGGGATWWVLAGKDDADANAMDHVDVSGGKLVVDDSDSGLGEYCDDTDDFTYNDCDTDTDETFEFVYKITNKGDAPANYSVVVNAFDKDGDFVAQTFIGVTHLEPGKTDSDKGEFNEYSTLEDDRDLSDIETVKTAYVERVALAN